MKNKNILFIWMLFATFASATTYENADSGTTDKWKVYDNRPAGAIIENVYDNTLNSNVIKLSGEGRKNAYILGHKSGKKAWKNSTEKHISWKMNFTEKFKIMVYVKTKLGQRILYYDYKNRDRGMYKRKYLRMGLGRHTKKGKWLTIERDLEVDLKKFEPKNSIVTVNAFRVNGSGMIDDVKLSNTTTKTTDKDKTDKFPGVCTREYMPVCGQLLNRRCITAPCEVNKTFANKCLLNNSHAKFLYAGKCKVNNSKNVIQQELDKNRALWKSFKLSNYKFTTDESSSSFGYRKWTIGVKNQKSAYYIKGNKNGEIKNIDGYFAMIQSLIKKAPVVVAKYDAKYGYPIYISYGNKPGSTMLGYGGTWKLYDFEIIGNNAVNSSLIKRVTTPIQGYSFVNIGTKVIETQKEYDLFLSEIKKGKDWGAKVQEFVNALSTHTIDFTKDNLVIYQVVDGLAPTKLTVSQPLVKNGHATIKIEKEKPAIGLTVMSYHLLSYQVSKKILDINFLNGNKKDIILNKSEKYDKHNTFDSCLAWYDGCNFCGRSDVNEAPICTMMACYKPGKITCTKWKK